MKSYCPACGTTVDQSMTECAVCGEPVAPADAPAGPADASAESSAEEKGAGRGSSFPLYLGSALVAVGLAVAIVLLANPAEVKGPPSGASAQQMPEGHPPMDGPNLTPEQKAALEQRRTELAHAADSIARIAGATPQVDTLERIVGDIYYDLNRHGEAVTWYRRYLEAHPEDNNARTDYAFSIANLDDLNGAIEQLRTVLRNDPRHQNAQYNMAMMFIAMRQRDSTVYWLDQVVRTDSTTKQGQNALAVLRGLADAHGGAPPTSQQ